MVDQQEESNISWGMSCLTVMLLFSFHPFDSYLFSTYYNHVGNLRANKALILNRMEVESNFHARSLFSGFVCFLFTQEVLTQEMNIYYFSLFLLVSIPISILISIKLSGRKGPDQILDPYGIIYPLQMNKYIHLSIFNIFLIY